MRVRRCLLPFSVAMSLWLCVAFACGQVTSLRVHAVASPPTLVQLPQLASGRVMETALKGADGFPQGFPQNYVTQWPGVSYRAAFAGPAVYFRVGNGDEILRVVVDGDSSARLVKPQAGVYAVDGLDSGPHTIEVLVATESQAGPVTFGGFALPAGERAMRAAQPSRQIEFIGDSHTVGYGDLSAVRTCTPEEVSAETDDTKAFGAVVARHYGAAYQVNAISGRGVVRNYNGLPAPTLPEAYPYVLFDQKQRYEDAAWKPQVLVIALGTNDFSTALHAGERWKSRDTLHADFETTYAHFLEGLRARNPQALMVVWATDMADGEIEAEAKKVVASLQQRGDRRVVFVPIDKLEFTACNAHPSLADEATIATKLMGAIDADAGVWGDGAAR